MSVSKDKPVEGEGNIGAQIIPAALGLTIVIFLSHCKNIKPPEQVPYGPITCDSSPSGEKHNSWLSWLGQQKKPCGHNGLVEKEDDLPPKHNSSFTNLSLREQYIWCVRNPSWAEKYKYISCDDVKQEYKSIESIFIESLQMEVDRVKIPLEKSQPYKIASPVQKAEMLKQTYETHKMPQILISKKKILEPQVVKKYRNKRYKNILLLTEVSTIAGVSLDIVLKTNGIPKNKDN